MKGIWRNYVYPAWLGTALFSFSALLFLVTVSLKPSFLGLLGRIRRFYPHPNETCIFCGGTEALRLLVQLNFASALRKNIYVVILVFVLALDLVLFLAYSLLWKFRLCGGKPIENRSQI